MLSKDRENEGTELAGWRTGEDLGGGGEGETVIRMNVWYENIIVNKNVKFLLWFYFSFETEICYVGWVISLNLICIIKI